MFNFFKKNKANQIPLDWETLGQQEMDIPWKKKHMTTRHMEFLIGTGTGSLAMALELIYSTLYTRDWNRIVPEPSELNDPMLLYYSEQTVLIFHKFHKKFGANIFEYDLGHRKNAYCFFDHSRLQGVMDWYDKFEEYEDDKASPSIPTYYALPEDRHYFYLHADYVD